MKERRWHRLIRFITYLALLASGYCGLLLASGCNRGSDSAGSASNKLKVAYLGLT